MSFRSVFKSPTPLPLLGPVLLLALGILGLTVALGYRHLRQAIVTQLEARDGEILHAVALSEEFGLQTNLVQRLQDPVEQLALTLKISRIQEGVLAVRLFDARGNFVTAFPPNVASANLSAAKYAELQRLHPATHYDAGARFADVFLMSPADASHTNTLPLLEVNIPLHAPGGTQLLAGAQLVLDAHDFAQESERIERHLRLQALGLFGMGAGLLTAVLAWAGHRLRKANQVIAERTASLLRANNELMLAAKTNALGAVAAHLIHGLSNPLANLQDFVRARESQADGWEEATRATQRMRQLVEEVVRVLGEGSQTDAYEITLAEMAQVLDSKVQPLARELHAQCEITVAVQGRISNHTANLVLLILENLIHNALQVTPPGKAVRVRFANGAAGVVCRVADEGPGFPEHLLKNVFSPCRSTKGGAGLGLAISQQLAKHLGSRLELKQSSAQGSTFELLLPLALTPRNRTLEATLMAT